MNTRAAGRGTTTAGIAATTDAVTTVAAAGERGRQGTTRGVIYQPGSTLTKFGTFPENRTTSVSRSLTGSSTVPFHRGGRCFVRLPVSRSLTGSSTVPVHRKGGSRQRMSGPSTMSHPAMWTCPACGRPLTVALNPEGGEAGAHRPLEISRASAAAHACAPAARFPQFHNASSSSITGYEPASCQPWQPPVSAGAEDDEGVISQSEYTLTKPSSCPNHRDHVRRTVPSYALALSAHCARRWLGWVGLGWVGLGWVGLGWVGLGWVGLGWVGLSFSAMPAFLRPVRSDTFLAFCRAALVGTSTRMTFLSAVLSTASLIALTFFCTSTQSVFVRTTKPIFRRSRFCWCGMFWSVVINTSYPARSASVSRSPLLIFSHPWLSAVRTSCSRSFFARGCGVPLSNSIFIGATLL